jgi:IclR helix-turn-helix domain
MNRAKHRRQGDGKARSHGVAKDISVVLTATQVREVARAINGVGDLQEWLLESLGSRDSQIETVGVSGPEKASLSHLSQSFLRGLAVLRALFPVGTGKGIYRLANEVKMTQSTTHRYVTTLKHAGLVEQDPETREYYLALSRKREPDDTA